MYEKIMQMRKEWGANDAKRDELLTVPEGLVRHLDIPYGDDDLQKLDVYYPEGTETALPTIISIHGGGWFYGSKELYSYYCMDLALRGFTVVNFSYRLAPEHKYPAAIEDCCTVLHWVKDHAAEYFIDLKNIFTVGDSAGGQLNFQLLTMLSNPAFAALFPFKAPEGFRVNAAGLNCGCYFMPFSRLLPPKRMGEIFDAYMPEDYMSVVPQLKMGRYITRSFPPAFVMSSGNDYLKIMAKPVHLLLKCKGVETVLHIFGTKADKELGHVFHLNCRLPQAKVCNDMQCEFFRRHMV